MGIGFKVSWGMEERRRKRKELHFTTATDSSDCSKKVGDFGTVSYNSALTPANFLREASLGSSLTTLGTTWHRPLSRLHTDHVSGGQAF